MSEVLHANIFFLIASIATVVFCIMVCIVLYHVIKIMRAIRAIIERIEAGSEVIAEDFASVRSFVQSGGMFSRMFGLFSGPSTHRRKGKRSSVTNEE